MSDHEILECGWLMLYIHHISCSLSYAFGLQHSPLIKFFSSSPSHSPLFVNLSLCSHYRVSFRSTLPPLAQQGTIIHSSLGNDRLSIRYMYLWPDVVQDTFAAVKGISMHRMISITNTMEGELFYVGNELGLTRRFVQNMGVPVTKAFKYGSKKPLLNCLRFTDYHSAGIATLFSDLSIVKDILDENSNITGCELRAAGEIKTFWTLPLHNIPVTASDAIKMRLEVPMGLFVCNHIACGHLQLWHILNIFPPCFCCNRKKQKRSCEPSPKQMKITKKKHQLLHHPLLDSL